MDHLNTLSVQMAEGGASGRVKITLDIVDFIGTIKAIASGEMNENEVLRIIDRNILDAISATGSSTANDDDSVSEEMQRNMFGGLHEYMSSNSGANFHSVPSRPQTNEKQPVSHAVPFCMKHNREGHWTNECLMHRFQPEIKRIRNTEVYPKGAEKTIRRQQRSDAWFAKIRDSPVPEWKRLAATRNKSNVERLNKHLQQKPRLSQSSSVNSAEEPKQHALDVGLQMAPTETSQVASELDNVLDGIETLQVV